MHRTLFRRFRSDETGIALVLTLTTMVVLTIAARRWSPTPPRVSTSSRRSGADAVAFNLAEAGVSNAVATLGNPATNALATTALPSSEAAAQTAASAAWTTKWWGVLNTQNQTGSIVGKGVIHNPTGAAAVTRTVGEQIDVLADLTQPLNNQAWNYLLATRAGDPDTCDEELRQSVTIAAPLYIDGNLCLFNTASIMPATAPPSPAPAVNLVVRGAVYLYQPQNTIGTNSKPIASAYLSNGCNGHVRCRWNGGGDPVYASAVGTTAPAITVPTVDWNAWYLGAAPGPRHPCSVSFGTPPVFDNNTTRDVNGSVAAFDLTPSAADYSCRVTSGGGATIGELSWNHTTKVLTVSGVIYIDGSAFVSQGPVNYNVQASLYLWGTFSMSRTAEFCGGVKNGACDFGSWNPNTELLVMADGNDGTGASVSLNQGARYQGGFYATNDIVVGQSSTFEGPMMGGALIFQQLGHREPVSADQHRAARDAGQPQRLREAAGPAELQG